MSETANDLAIDLLWFFDSQSWQPELNIDQQMALELVSLKLGCSLTYITDDNNKESQLVSTWQSTVRTLMKDLGFYAGQFKSPNRDYYLKKLPQKKLSFAEPKGTVAHVFVTVKECKAANDEAACAYANEARSRKAKQPGGILVEVKRTEGLSELWAALRKALKCRRVREIQFFDHGAVEQQVVGGDTLTAQSTIPDDVGSRFASGAEIVLYGCTTMLGKMPGKNVLSLLATNLANHLLVRGGKVIGFSSVVGLDVTHMKVIEPPPKDRVVRTFGPCNALDVMDEVLKLMRGMKGTYRIKYSCLAPARQSLQTAAFDALDYPSDYPNIGYYT